MAKSKKSSDGGLDPKDQKLLSDFIKKQAKGSKELSSAQKAITEAKETELDFSNKLLQKEKEIIALIEQKKKAHKELADYTEQYNVLIKGASKETLAQNKDLAKQILYGKQRAKNALKQLDSEISIKDNSKKALKTAIEVTKQKEASLKNLEKMSEKAEELVEHYDEMFESVGEIDTLIKKIPGGEFFSKIIGTDKLQEKIKKQVTDQLANAQAAGSGLGKVLGKAALTLGAFWAIAKFVEWFKEMDEETVQLAKNLDITRSQAADLHHTAHDIAAEMAITGVHTEQVTKAMTELKNVSGLNYGLMSETNQAAKDLVSTTALLMEKQGLSGEEAYALNEAATITGQSYENLALQAETMGDELMSGRDIMKDVGKVSKKVLTNFANNPKELVKAVKQAKLLGTTLDAINNAGDALLDIESSLENEMKANVLLGKNMNLDKARQAALAGDTATLMSEIATQAGDAAAFDKMNVVQKKALAAAVGLNVDQLAEMMTKQKELNKLGYTQEQLDKSLALTGSERAAELERIAKYGKAGAAEALKAKYLEQDRVTTSEAFSSAMKEASDSMKTVLLPVVESIAKGLKTFAPLIKPITIGLASLAAVAIGAMAISKASSVIKSGIGAVKSIGGFFGKGGSISDSLQTESDKINKAGSSMSNNTKSLSDKFKGIADSVKSFFDILRNAVKGIMGIVTDVFTGVGEALAGFFKAFSSISFTDLIKGALALGIMAGSLWLMGEALQKFADIGLDDLGIAALALVGLTAAVVGLGMILPLIAAGSLALGIMSAAFWVFGEAAASVADAMPGIASGFKLFGDIDGGNLISVAAGIGALSLALAGYGAGSALSGIGSALGSLFDEDPVKKFNRFSEINANKLLTVASAITALGAAFKNFSTAVSSIGDTSGITDTIDKVMQLHDTMSESPIESAVNAVSAGIGNLFSAASSWISSVSPGSESVNTGGGVSSEVASTNPQNSSMSEVTALLKQLIAKVDQPVQLNIGGKAIDEISKQTSVRKSYSAKVDGAYGAMA